MSVTAGWYDVEFDDLRVEPVDRTDVRCWRTWPDGAKASASSAWSSEYGADRVNDGKPETRWNAAKGHLAGEWVELDFGRQVRLDTVSVQQFGARSPSTSFKLPESDRVAGHRQPGVPGTSPVVGHVRRRSRPPSCGWSSKP